MSQCHVANRARGLLAALLELPGAALRGLYSQARGCCLDDPVINEPILACLEAKSILVQWRLSGPDVRGLGSIWATVYVSQLGPVRGQQVPPQKAI